MRAESILFALVTVWCGGCWQTDLDHGNKTALPNECGDQTGCDAPPRAAPCDGGPEERPAGTGGEGAICDDTPDRGGGDAGESTGDDEDCQCLADAGAGEGCACTDCPPARQCEPGETTCIDDGGEAVCIATESDPENCGGCSHSCPDKAACVAGRCLCDGLPCCAPPLQRCTNDRGLSLCVDPMTDEAHCGACGAACAMDERCVSGACTECLPTLFHLPGRIYEAGPLLGEMDSRPLVADIDGDGHRDVAINNFRQDQVRIFPGAGTGDLRAPWIIDTVHEPASLAFADLNPESQRGDLIVGGTGGLAVYFDFEAHRQSPFTLFELDISWEEHFLYSKQVLVTDMTGDNRPDVLLLLGIPTMRAVRNYHNEVWLLEGLSPTGAGFTATRIGSDMPAIAEMVPMDLNRDGRLDLVLIGSTVRVLYAEPDGSWRMDSLGMRLNSSHDTVLHVHDFNSDGWIDVMTGRATGFGTVVTGHYLSMQFGNDLGKFDEIPDRDITLSYITDPITRLLDWNRDGHADVLARVDSNVVTVTGAGDGTFVESARTVVGSGYGCPFEAGDLNDDGRPDLVVPHADAENATLSVHLGLPDGSFTSHLPRPEETVFVGSAAIHTYTDHPEPLIIGTNGKLNDGGALRVAAHSPGGRFESLQEVPLYRPKGVTLGDADGDGHPDAFVTVDNGLYLIRYEGNGRFAPSSERLVSERYSEVAGTGDVDGDGQPEILVRTREYQDDPETTTLRLLSKGDSGWRAEVYALPCGQEAQVRLADFNGDGLADIGVTNCPRGADGRSTVHIWPGRPGARRLEPASTFTFEPGESCTRLYAADVVPGGGKEIIAASATHSTVIEVSPELEMRALRPYSPPGFSGSGPFELMDVNGDGFLDILEPYDAERYYLWEGDGRGHFEQTDDYLLPGFGQPVGLADFDEDGLGDLLFSGNLMFLKGAPRCRY